MAKDTVITVVGHLGGAPELRFTPSGAAVVNFSVGSTPSHFDKQTNEWVDDETLWLRCSAWRDLAENIAESLDKGSHVIVQGRLKSRSYETKEGERRTVTELDIDTIGPALNYASAKVTKTKRGGNRDSGGFGGGSSGGFGGGAQQGGGFGGGQQSGGQPQGGQQSGSPWTGGTQGGGGQYDWGAGQDDEPPF